MIAPQQTIECGWIDYNQVRSLSALDFPDAGGIRNGLRE
jgi:hypothetical protein